MRVASELYDQAAVVFHDVSGAYSTFSNREYAMTAWRMAFRAGTNGDEMWLHCHRLGVAAIGYSPVDDIDLSRYSEGEPRSAWSQLWSSQQASLKRLVYEMEEGDIIYVKQGPLIVGRGVVAGPYRFDRRNRIQSPDGTLWQHQHPVKWTAGFPEVPIQIGRQQAVTLVPLTGEDVKRVEQAAAACFADESDLEGMKTESAQFKSKRSRRLRELAFNAAHGICCVCGRDYSKLLGGRGVRVLQVHHRDQLSARDAPSMTKLRDLAVVCANCHLLLHLDPKNALRVEKLREMLEADGFLG
jgi:hypothetical protein